MAAQHEDNKISLSERWLTIIGYDFVWTLLRREKEYEYDRCPELPPISVSLRETLMFLVYNRRLARNADIRAALHNIPAYHLTYTHFCMCANAVLNEAETGWDRLITMLALGAEQLCTSYDDETCRAFTSTYTLI